MLRMALNIHWQQMISNVDLFGNIPKPSVMIANRRMRMSGHIARHDDLLANQLLFWDPQHGYRGPGRPHLTFIDMLKKDTSLSSVFSQVFFLMHLRVLEVSLAGVCFWGPGKKALAPGPRPVPLK